MKRTSMIALGVCAFLVAYLLMVFIPLKNQNEPDMTADRAAQMLNNLAVAFQDSSTDRVLGFAAPDAKIAGRDLDNIRKLLQAAFREMKQPKVDWSDVKFDKTGSQAHITAHVTVRDSDGGNPNAHYAANVGFVVEQRTEKHLMGLMSVDKWKIVSVDAPSLPEIGM